MLAVALSGCGSSAAGRPPIVFGITGGNIAPYRVSIQPNGTVRVRGSLQVRRRQVPAATVRRLRREVQGSNLRSRRCAGTLPDVGSQFIRVGSRTVTVHGGCDPRFAGVWNDLGQAVGLR